MPDDIECAGRRDPWPPKVLHGVTPIFTRRFECGTRAARLFGIHCPATQADYLLQVNVWPLSQQVKSGPNHRWQDAMEIPFGKTVFASATTPSIFLYRHPRRAKRRKPKR